VWENYSFQSAETRLLLPPWPSKPLFYHGERSHVATLLPLWRPLALPDHQKGNGVAFLERRSWGYVSAIDSEGQTIWIVDAHRDDGKRFVVRADEKLTAFLELESAIRACGDCA
jgi:hypothetical protein